MTKPTLEALLARVEAAEEGSRELEADAFRALGFRVENIRRPGAEYLVLTEEDDWRKPGSYILLPMVTRSIDDALALAKRVLPGWGVSINAVKQPNAEVFETDADGFFNSADHRHAGATAKKPALAVVAAALRALIAQETEVAHEDA